jgi:carnitine-CoA ligase
METAGMEPLDAGRVFAPLHRSVPVMLQRQAEKHGEKPLICAGDRIFTFAEMPALASRAASRLKLAGIGHGDRVALMCSNRPEFIEMLLGCAWLGAILVPINTAARGASLHYVLANSGARLLVMEGRLLGALALVDLASLALERIWLIDAPSADAPLPPIAGPVPEAGATTPAAALRPGDLLAILYTSGTTGPSKGVCCPHAQFFWWGLNTIHLLGVGEDDILCTTLPLFHVNALGSFFQALIAGATVNYEPCFSASGFFKTLAARRATVTYLLGAMVPILLSRAPSEEERGHPTRIALAPGVPGHLHAEFAARTGIVLLDGYGSTETNVVIGARIEQQKPGYMGPVFDGFAARVVDEDDNDVPDGEPGELVLRADAPFAFATGYFGVPEKTVEAWRNLWFHSGDRVIREQDGYFKFVDRLKDVIRRRGENVSSFEVEQVLLSHPEVAIAAIFPVPSELAEDEVMAAVVRQPASTLSEADLIRFCESRMAYFAIPRYVEFYSALPVTENGKIEKYKLRERGVTKGTWDREAAGIKVRR